MIKAGVRVGHGSVVGMGSVVTRDVKPYSIVAGNPARLIRLRFEPDMISALLSLEWWNWPADKLARYGLYFDNPHELLSKVQTL